MMENTKKDAEDEIQLVLLMLRNVLTRNGYSVGYHSVENALIFFNTATYIKNGSFDGLSVKIDNLVN